MRGLYDNRSGDYRNLYSQDFAKNFPFSVEQVGTDYCSEEYFLSRENSPLSVVGYTFQGRGILHQDGKTYRVEENQFFILKSGLSHSYYPKKNWAFCWFNVIGDLEKLLSLYGIDREVVFYCPPMNAPFLDAVSYCVKAENGIYNAQLHGQSFLLSLLPQLRYATFFNYDDELKIEMKLKIMLEKHCFTKYDFSEICSRLGITKRHAQRVFKEKYGISPHEYVLQLRYQQACSLLMLPSHTIKEIAFMLGFSDEKYFSNFFKNRSGFYPNIYRKLVKK